MVTNENTEQNTEEKGSGSWSFVDELQKMINTRLADKDGDIEAADIIDALGDQFKDGSYAATVSLTEDYIDPYLMETRRSVNRVSTIQCRPELYAAGGYTTIALTFGKNLDDDLRVMWQALRKYGEENLKTASLTADKLVEIPAMYLTIVPMSLGGNYGIVGASPIYWTLQPENPHSEAANQIRLLFQPENVVFMRDDSFTTAQLLQTVRNEIASNQLSEENRLQAEALRKQYDQANEEQIQNFVSKNVTRHSFTYEDGALKTDKTIRNAWNDRYENVQSAIGKAYGEALIGQKEKDKKQEN